MQVKPFPGYGHFCTKCGHTQKLHSVVMPTMATYPLRKPRGKACSLPGCDCRYYYEGGDA